jgi:tricorn protease
MSNIFLKRPKSVQKKQVFEMLFEHGEKICRAIGLGCHPILKNLVLLVLVGLMMSQFLYGQVDARLLRYPDVSDTQITFVYAGDIWIAPRTGGVAQRLSSPKGEEMFPRFSPDGKHIAFSGNYDGNTDVYVVPVKGGIPVRVTHHPFSDWLVDWYPDGKSLLYSSTMASYRSRLRQFYRTSPKGGMPEKLALPYGVFASFSADAKQMAFTTISNDFSTWKRYRGGRVPDIWIFDLEKKSAENITDNDAGDSLPMWHGSTIYFISDQEESKRVNIWAYDTNTKKTRQVTTFKDYDVRFPALGPQDIIFENGGRLYLLNLGNEKINEVEISVVTDKATLKPRLENVSSMIRSAGISPTGKRVLVEARGEIFTVPAKEGIVRNLTRTPGIAERYPSWSPDGKWIAYFSDRSGEYSLYMRPADGSGNETLVHSFGKGYRYRPQWSPDSKKLLFTNKKKEILLFDRQTKKITVIDKLVRSNHFSMERFNVTWTSDSRWIAYTSTADNGSGTIVIYDLKTNELHPVTNGYYTDWRPEFDPAGDFLYFLSNRSLSPTYSDLEGTWVYVNTTRIVAMALRKDVKSPFIPENDREEVKEEKGPDADKSKAKENNSKKKNGDKKEKPEIKPVKIDFDGIRNRLIVLPVKDGNFMKLAAIKGKLIFHRWRRTGESADSKKPIAWFDFKDKKEQTILDDADRFSISSDREKMLVRKDRNYAVIDVKPGQKFKKPLTIELEMMIDPVQEWRQVFTDAWRFERDFFYDPGTHGVDWKLMRERYGKLLKDAVTRWDVHFLIGELIGELSAGHVYRFSPPVEKELRRGVGLLGVDFELHQGAYRIKKIIDVNVWDTELQSPLKMPGIHVKEGDYILAVNGVPIDTSKDPWAAFQGKAGKTVLLTVNSTPSITGAREVLVKTLSSEANLREKAWVEENRKKVAEATGDRVGYIYVRNTSLDGQTELVRQFLAQFKKEGLIVDERFNSGGQLADRFIELMNRPLYNHFYVRDAENWSFPGVSHTGPKVMLMNGWAGSGGDAFPYYFKKAGLGPLIGTRTWGGLVGPVYFLPLIDGGGVSCPPARILSTDGKWMIENVGVKPDIYLLNDPGLMAQGKDPQLERGIEEVLELIKKNPPPPPPQRPPFPRKK